MMYSNIGLSFCETFPLRQHAPRDKTSGGFFGLKLNGNGMKMLILCTSSIRFLFNLDFVFKEAILCKNFNFSFETGISSTCFVFVISLHTLHNIYTGGGCVSEGRGEGARKPPVQLFFHFYITEA